MAPATREQEARYTPPERSKVQRMEALGRANHVRTKRAALKRDLKARRKLVDQVLLNPPEYIEDMKVFDLMLAVPQYGRTRITKLFRTCQISPSKTVDGLSHRQRDELIFRMRRY